MSTWPTFPSEKTFTLSPSKVGGEGEETKYENAGVLVPYNEEKIHLLAVLPGRFLFIQHNILYWL